MKTFASLSGPDFLKLSRQQIKALSLDELQELVLRSQRLLAKAMFKPVQCMFEVMPDEYMIEMFLEWLPIEDLSRFELALMNHYYRDKYLSLLLDTVHRGVLSVSRRRHKFNSGVAEWLESRNIFMRGLTFYDSVGDIPAGFLARIGPKLSGLTLISAKGVTFQGLQTIVQNCLNIDSISLGRVRWETIVGGGGYDRYGLLGSLRALKSLYIPFTRITDPALCKIAEGCILLEEVHLLILEAVLILAARRATAP